MEISMPLSDLFKKSPKKESAKSSATDDSPFSPEMQKKCYEAALDFVKVLQQRFSGENAHAGTVLSTAARLAGTSLYRSLHYKNDFTPGVVVLSDEVNEAWPRLMNLFAFYCKQHGADVMSQPLVTKFPDKDKPRLTVQQVQREFQDQYNAIMKRHELDALNSARAGMLVASIIFEYHTKVAKDIDPRIATGIVAMGVVEGAKTAPPPLGSGSVTSSPSDEKVRDDKRLVLGERDAVLREALDHGGSYIDLNPEVLRTLQAANIDPYLIYEKAMLNKIEEKIPRIDFAQVDVDKTVDEWKSRPQMQAPIFVRLIFWLKKNAAMYGYKQDENSWIRRG
jgi:hypothetical protein